MPALARHPAALIEPSGQAPSGLEHLSMHDLRDLMETVTLTTQRLQATHVALQDQVARLQRELAEANAALQRSQALAALGEMAAGIAHEIRNPLGSIQLYAQMLGEDLADRPPQAELCSRINRAVVTLDAIVRDVLSFARETRLDPRPTTAEELFEAARMSCAALISAHDVEVRVEVEPAQTLLVDAGLTTQALANVMRNAIEAMVEHPGPTPERPMLSLSAQRRRARDSAGRMQACLGLCVEDRGPGIPADVRARVFNPFFTTRATGTGLGLAIVHRIIDAHGGRIRIDDVKPRGTRVELCLPVRRIDPAPAPASSPRAPSFPPSAAATPAPALALVRD